MHIYSYISISNSPRISISHFLVFLQTTHQSKRVKNTLDPIFNEEFRFRWNGSDYLHCHVLDFDLGNGDDEDDALGM